MWNVVYIGIANIEESFQCTLIALSWRMRRIKGAKKFANCKAGLEKRIIGEKYQIIIVIGKLNKIIRY